MTSAPQQGYVHISVRNAQRRAERVRAYREADQSRLKAVPSAEDPAPENGVAPLHIETEARGFVRYVGMDAQSALARGPSLSRLSNELLHYLRPLVPCAASYAAVAIASADVAGEDLDVVRQVTADPTIQQTISPDLAAAPAPVSTRQPGVLIDI